ncbi:triphosphoribosyl-dephospho-CoA synthase MdcB [Bordetella flabilis]|uniref:Probable 2-(5''-triphosphoribosyl)-3'-dephosphocoenzyme-A synthase n=1 Tax=Bordetella flabilis TaxID=463014 RepID=A0A193GL16_9BORD|nr:triphosphoribosyl-dephospho-CoA synthase MdcB [Bordetella flabilis]
MNAALLSRAWSDRTPTGRALDCADHIAVHAEHCLRREVETWPKPGLVSHVDSGSHRDMDVHTFRRSARALRPYFAELARAGALGAPMAALRKIGVRAEAAMMSATGGVNTHRGAIFGVGLLCAAAGARDVPGEALGVVVTNRWGADIGAGPRPADSHGVAAAHRYGAGGARAEAASGFPSVYEIGLPALREAERMAAGDEEAMRVQACFALIAVVQDTNLLHRGGAEGLRFAQETARRFMRQGGIANPHWREAARAAHAAFVARNLSPGGSADLLAMSLFVHGMP